MLGIVLVFWEFVVVTLVSGKLYTVSTENHPNENVQLNCINYAS